MRNVSPGELKISQSLTLHNEIEQQRSGLYQVFESRFLKNHLSHFVRKGPVRSGWFRLARRLQSRQQPRGRRWMPRAATRREDAALIEFGSNATDATDTLSPQVVHDGA